MADNVLGVCGRTLLVFINLFYLVVSIVPIGLGIFLLVEEQTVNNIAGKNLVAISIIILIIGVILFITAVIAILGSVANSACLLSLYCFLVFLLIGAEIVTAIMSFVFLGKIQDQVDTQLLVYIQNYTTTTTSDHYNKGTNKVIDFIQESFKCCGLTGPTDWLVLNPLYVTAHGVPKSCQCDEDSDKCISVPLIDFSVWKQGCNETFYDFVHNNVLALGGSALCFSALQFFVLLLSCATCCCALFDGRRRRSEYRYTRLETTPTGPVLREYVEEKESVVV